MKAKTKPNVVSHMPVIQEKVEADDHDRVTDSCTSDTNNAPTKPKRAILYLRVSTSRQATKNGEAEGYSIPAQRSACQRKAAELGAEVEVEFVDAGASARSADRAGLQELLSFVSAGGVDYVLVHKLDRLARDRADDVAIVLAIRNAGATLVSASEQIDETPSGMLMHGIMASMAEFYSRNLANEAKKGIAQKAKNGGTHGVAPLGYVNTLSRIDGKEVKGVAIDEDRAEHIRWAYETYASGDWSISSLRDGLEERGLKSRTTQSFVGQPLNNSQVHRMLTNPYYIGKIRHLGIVYDGVHEPLVSEDTWYRVQEILAARRLAGDRSWRHTHYLKGLLVCGRCGGRMGYGFSRGKGGTYAYFFCLGRHTGRTDCDLPYVPVDIVESSMEQTWVKNVNFSKDCIEQIDRVGHEELDNLQHCDQVILASQQQRLTKLERQKQKLIDAYLLEAIPVTDLKQRQAGLMAEINDAHRLIEVSQHNMALVRERFEMILTLLGNAGELYKVVDEHGKKMLNEAVFKRILVFVNNDEESESWNTRTCELTGEFAEPVAEVVKLGQMTTPETKSRDRATRRLTCEEKSQNGQISPTNATSQEKQKETPDELSLTEGSNLCHLAERVGFEPTVRESAQRFSRPLQCKPNYIPMHVQVLSIGGNQKSIRTNSRQIDIKADWPRNPLLLDSQRDTPHCMR